MYVCAVSLSQYLLYLGIGARKQNLALSIVANPTPTVPVATNGKIIPNVGDQGILVVSIQFDGVLSGQLSYDLDFGEQGDEAGYAIQQVEQSVEMFASGPVVYQFLSSQNQICVVNIDYLSLSSNTIQQYIREALFDVIPGGRFGTVRG